MDEQKLRSHLEQLRQERQAVTLTMAELESVHLHPLDDHEHELLTPNPDAQRLDLENAVLMQELMAIKVGIHV